MIGRLETFLFMCLLGAIHTATTRHSLVHRRSAFLSLGTVMESRGQGQQRIQTQKRMQVRASDHTAAGGLQEVIDVLLQMLRAFSTQEMEDRKLWEEYATFSDTSEKDKRGFIQVQNALIMSETAKKESNQKMLAALTEELSTLANEIKGTQMGVEGLTQMRKQEQRAFQATQTDLTQTIKAVVEATEILQGRHAVDNAQLMQVKQRVQLALSMYGTRIRSATKSNLMAFASLLSIRQTDIDGKQGGAGGVIGMLGNLQSDLQSQLEAAIAREAENNRQYEATKAAKETDLKHQADTQATKQQAKATAGATIETCISTIDQAKTEMLDAEEFLKQLLADRQKFQKEFTERNSVRSDERAATQAALDVLAAVKARTKKAEDVSFLQTSSKSTKHINKLLRMLNDHAHISHQIKSISSIQVASETYATHRLASQMYAKYDAMDPSAQFDPVVKLLTELITTLEEEAAAETSQHEWCETEKTSSVTVKVERETSIAEARIQISEETTSIATLKTDILFMESELARIKKETEVAKVLREEQHGAYVEAKEEHTEVIKAIGIALDALDRQFGGGAAFIQVEASQNQVVNQAANSEAGQDSIFSDSKSSKLNAGSAIGLLEDLQARYTNGLQELEQTETDQQKAHEKLLDNNTQFITDTTNTMNLKLTERREKLGQLGDAKGQMRTNLVELHEVNRYLQNLRPSCDDIRTTYEERKKRREAEIAALKEALDVISDPSMMSS